MHRPFHQSLSRAAQLPAMLVQKTQKNSRRRARKVLTLRPDRLSAVGQAVLDVGGVRYPTLAIRNMDDYSSMRIIFDFAKSPFPVGTKGVFHFHHVAGDDRQSQLRFRLCDTLDGFGQGTDLLSPSGKPWGVSLRTMKLNADYETVFALLKQEFSVEIPPDFNRARYTRRTISTLDPRKLPFSEDAVINVSGITRRIITLSGAEEVSTIMPPFLVDQKPPHTVPYPAGTTGVYYYKQSTVSPTRLGELRFRICASVEEFEQGTDLCLPSGSVWHVSSAAISVSKLTYAGIHNALKAEGLLEGHSHPTLARGQYPLSLKTPFALELSFQRHVLYYTQEPQTNIALRKWFRRKPDTPLFSGRVIVQLEEYPGRLSSGDGPLLAVRILEHMTPIKTLTEDDYMQFPKPGKLISVLDRQSGQYMPKGYNPRNSAIRKYILSMLK